MNNNFKDSLLKLFHQSINQHGYSFQYSIIQKIIDLSKNNAFPWYVEVSEFPVNVNDNDLHIDFILKHHEEQIYIIAECKRANPALSDWCYARSPFVHKRQRRKFNIILEKIYRNWQSHLFSEPFFIDKTNDAFHIMFEIKTNKKGDKYSDGRGVYNSAVTQALRGVNGFANFLVEKKLVEKEKWAIIIPVIFTTANLFISDVDLSSADISNGNIDYSMINLEIKNWLWFQYHQSINLKHSITINKDYKELFDILDNEYSRSIATVNSNSIEDFLIYLDDLICS